MSCWFCGGGEEAGPLLVDGDDRIHEACLRRIEKEVEKMALPPERQRQGDE